MKNIKFLTIILALTMFVSCDKYDNYDASELPIVGFTRENLNINNIPAGGEKTSEVNVFASTSSSSERTFNIVVVPINDEENYPTADPENYSFTSSVTIPANERIGVVTVTGKNISLPEDGAYILLAIESDPDVIAGGKIRVRFRP